MTGDSIKEPDALVIGGGVLGTSLAYWLSTLYEGKVVLLEREPSLGSVTTRRNTGVIHRPFYLDPYRKSIFAKSAQISYGMWKTLSQKYGLPWSQVGTLELALTESSMGTLDSYHTWALQNGMAEDEIRILDSNGIKEIEPAISANGGILSLTDTSTDFQSLTQKLGEIVESGGGSVLTSTCVTGIRQEGGGTVITATTGGNPVEFRPKFTVNAMGSPSLSMAHELGLGMEFTTLFFRGEYWKLREEKKPGISRNIYTIPQYREFPFLDPHLIVKHDGRMEIGPNAVPVADPSAYRGISSSPSELVNLLFGRPVMPKLNLLMNRKFLSLAAGEWKSSIGKRFMIDRVRKFVPGINSEDFSERGISGIRGSVIDRKGFVPEAVTLAGDSSIHIVNYNSPGATGAPAFSLHVIMEASAKGYLDSMKSKDYGEGIWDYRTTTFD